MAIPSTQSIRLSDISVELGLPRTTKMALGHPDVRTFLGIPSGKVGLGQVRGASFGRAIVSRVISAHSQNLTINLNTLPGYQAGKSDITITVDPGIYVWSDNANPALTITGGTTGDTLKLVNNGFIMGKGGTGQSYHPDALDRAATPGNPAMSIGMNIVIDTQNGYIAGGGGGGGGWMSGGGGAGGGLGGQYDGYSTGGAPGAIGQPGGNGVGEYGPGGGGGRILPGVGGGRRTVTTMVSQVGLGGQSGGGGGMNYLCGMSPGGGGGGWGAKGGDQITSTTYDATGFTATSGKGGDANNNGENSSIVGGAQSVVNYIGAPGGKAIITNGRGVTYVGSSASRVFGIVG